MALSYEVAKIALSELLAPPQAPKDETPDARDPRPYLEAFHHVMWLPDHTSAEGPELYICMARDEVVLVSVGTAERALQASSSQPSAPFDSVRFPFSCIEEVTVDALNEDIFALVLKDRPKPLSDYPVLQFSSVYRREVLASLQVLFNSSITVQKEELATLPLRFVNVNTRSIEDAQQHPAFSLFESMPSDLQRGKKVFFRAGYMFMLPQHCMDAYQLLSDRPTSTYVMREGRTAAGAHGDVRKTGVKHLVMRILPPKPVSMDQNGLQAFHLWTECIAHAVAESEATFEASSLGTSVAQGDYTDSYFIPERGVYRKKLNVAGDRCQYVCYRVHVFTRVR